MYENQVIAVVMPALNEERSLPSVLGAVPSWVDRVVVVDNGSTDRTAAVAAHHGAIVLRQPTRGYGIACLTGIAQVPEAETVVFLDADFSDDPAQMERLVLPIVRGDADLVIGSRTLGQREQGSLSVQQRFGNALACGLMRLFWKHRYTDLGPFRAIRADALAALRMDDKTYGWTIQMQIRALRAGLRVIEVPVDYRRRIGTSKISGTVSGVLRAGAKILGTIAQERFHPCLVARVTPRPEHVIVFTRYPEPGRTKTRLIPALGAEGAAALQRGLTLHTLSVVDQLKALGRCSVEVRYEGGSHEQMQDAFGVGRVYKRQHQGDLGSRLHGAFVESFAKGAEGTLIIGSDCPSLKSDVLETAFAAMRSHDIVLGPARDGGYYLIGLRRSCAGLFTGVEWGSSRVHAQTMERAAAFGLSVHNLGVLHDIDEPDDLGKLPTGLEALIRDGSVPRLSVIIPTLNEAQLLADCIASIPTGAEIETIIADGGSTDGTVERAHALGATVVSAPRGRAAQMNAGAAVARGEMLLFLHADTRLRLQAEREVARLLAEPGVVLAAFRLGIDHRSIALGCIEFLANFRSRWLGMPYGDQALTVRSDRFRSAGGFRELPVMEDFEFVRRMHRFGKIRLSCLAVSTSPRRWLRDGVLQTMLVNQLCILGYLCGVSPQTLWRWRNRNGKSGVPISCPPARAEVDSFEVPAQDS
jgi:rSAM/selenodomain-associated transferase 2/rSAM/selenodomain-associated transferase 1